MSVRPNVATARRRRCSRSWPSGSSYAALTSHRRRAPRRATRGRPVGDDPADGDLRAGATAAARRSLGRLGLEHGDRGRATAVARRTGRGPERPLSVVSATVAWRATAGDCATQRDRDARAHHRRRAHLGVVHVAAARRSTALVATSRRAVTVLGKDAACDVMRERDHRGRRADLGHLRRGRVEPRRRARSARRTASPPSRAGPTGVVVARRHDRRQRVRAVRRRAHRRHRRRRVLATRRAARCPEPWASRSAPQGTVLAVVRGPKAATGLRVSASGDDGATWNPGLCLRRRRARAGERSASTPTGRSAMLVTGTTGPRHRRRRRDLVAPPDSRVPWSGAARRGASPSTGRSGWARPRRGSCADRR